MSDDRRCACMGCLLWDVLPTNFRSAPHVNPCKCGQNCKCKCTMKAEVEAVLASVRTASTVDANR